MDPDSKPKQGGMSLGDLFRRGMIQGSSRTKIPLQPMNQRRRFRRRRHDIQDGLVKPRMNDRGKANARQVENRRRRRAAVSQARH